MPDDAAGIPTPAMMALQSLPHVAQRCYRVRRDGAQWCAVVTAGIEDAPPIMWVGRGDSRAAAVEDAAQSALSYWRQWGGGA